MAFSGTAWRANALAGNDPKVEVLPLTEQMMEFLQAEAATGQTWRIYVSLIAGAAVVVAAIPTVIYIVQHHSGCCTSRRSSACELTSGQ